VRGARDGDCSGGADGASEDLRIVGQQISTVVAFAIVDRLAAAIGGIPPPENAWQLEQVPSADETRGRGAAWAPHRTYAAALLWRSLSPAAALNG
jgi:3-methyladenine DNA glycosylase/8-oxoguanine DNA glycosylase